MSLRLLSCFFIKVLLFSYLFGLKEAYPDWTSLFFPGGIYAFPPIAFSASRTTCPAFRMLSSLACAAFIGQNGANFFVGDGFGRSGRIRDRCGHLVGSFFWCRSCGRILCRGGFGAGIIRLLKQGGDGSWVRAEPVEAFCQVGFVLFCHVGCSSFLWCAHT